MSSATRFSLISDENVPSRLEQHERTTFSLLSCNEQLLKQCIAWSIKHHCWIFVERQMLFIQAISNLAFS